MANFNIDRMRADVVQVGDLIINQSAVINHESGDRQVAAVLNDLLEAVRALQVSGALDCEHSGRLHAALRAAADEAQSLAPRRSRFVSALENARTLAGGLASTAGIVEAINRILGAIYGES